MKTEYNFSRDYVQLYELICDGFVAIGIVNYKWHGTDTPLSRDVCKIRKNEFDISFGARGIQYGGVSESEARRSNEKDEFIKECERMELDWINPLNKT